VPVRGAPIYVSAYRRAIASASRSAAFGPPHARLLNKIFIEAPHWFGKIKLLGNEPSCST
jgi:hypothetical protein